MRRGSWAVTFQITISGDIPHSYSCHTTAILGRFLARPIVAGRKEFTQRLYRPLHRVRGGIAEHLVEQGRDDKPSGVLCLTPQRADAGGSVENVHDAALFRKRGKRDQKFPDYPLTNIGLGTTRALRNQIIALCIQEIEQKIPIKFFRDTNAAYRLVRCCINIQYGQFSDCRAVQRDEHRSSWKYLCTRVFQAKMGNVFGGFRQ